MKKLTPGALSKHTKIACSFQGGGALGAYQVGVARALDEAGYFPDWFVGTSIGAINAALAAGNPPNIRIEKMHQFWDSIATPAFLTPTFGFDTPESKKIQHWMSSQATLLLGQPDFFKPRFPGPEFGWCHTADTLSYYDSSPLYSTLERFIDFDRINYHDATRLSVGAVEVCSGQMNYFDSFKQSIGPEHIMASAALPPGFPAVEIEGKFYWDGGISSNSPGTYVLSDRCPKNLLCFAVHLFDSFGLYPTTLDEVIKRKKDIEFSSKVTKLLELYKEIHDLKNTIHTLAQWIPKDQKLSRKLKACISKGRESTVCVVRFLYEEDSTELSSKDYEFSEKTIKERIAHGYKAGLKAIRLSPWLEPVPQNEGIVVHDMAAKHTDAGEQE